MLEYFTVIAENGPGFEVGVLGVKPDTIEEAREQFRYWRRAGAARIRVARVRSWGPADKEVARITDWRRQQAA